LTKCAYKNQTIKSVSNLSFSSADDRHYLLHHQTTDIEGFESQLDQLYHSMIDLACGHKINITDTISFSNSYYLHVTANTVRFSHVLVHLVIFCCISKVKSKAIPVKDREGP
jgi:hypothetical protein